MKGLMKEIRALNLKKRSPGIKGKVAGRGKFNLGKMLRKSGVGHELSNIGRGALRRVGSTIVGSGAYMGRGRYSGRGAYESNALVNGDSNFAVARTRAHDDEHGSITVEKREFVTSINSTGSNDFSVQSFSINPGLSGVFPWLSQTGTNFDEWESIQMLFEYEPVVSETSVSSVGSLGTIVLASNYNAGAAAFNSFPAMIEYGGAVRGRISDNIICGVEGDPNKLANRSKLYTRAGSVPAGQDIKTYDLAKFQIGLYGVPTQYVAGTQLGLLFVRYKVKLSKPKLYDAIGYSILSDCFMSGGTISNALPLGTAPWAHNSNGLGGTLSKLSANTYTLPDNFTGTISVTFTCSFDAPPTTAPLPIVTVGGSANVVELDVITLSGSAYGAIESKGTSVRECYVNYYTVDLPDNLGDNTLTFSVSDTATNTTCFVNVCEFNPAMSEIISNRTAV